MLMPLPDDNLSGLSTTQLYAACPRYRAPRTILEETACYELWKRALRDRDEDAFQHLITLYRRLVAWLLNDWGQDEYHVMLVFIKIWYRYATPDFEQHFPSLAAVVAVLRRSAATTCVDLARAATREALRLSAVQSFAMNVDEGIESQVEQRWQHAQLHQAIWQRLKDADEKLIFTLTYQLDRAPAEIARLHPERFTSAEAVSTIKERILKRLRRDDRLRELWLRS